MISSAEAEANQLLCVQLFRHLDEAEHLALKFEQWDDKDIESARKLIPDLIHLVRSVLRLHEGTWHGNCRFCHHSWPCPTVRAIHQVVKDPDLEFTTLIHLADHQLDRA